MESLGLERQISARFPAFMLGHVETQKYARNYDLRVRAIGQIHPEPRKNMGRAIQIAPVNGA